ncbi:MAG TPA: carboxypeptidase-like regulatory domain-containing protein [Terriglobales bacterium]
MKSLMIAAVTMACCSSLIAQPIRVSGVVRDSMDAVIANAYVSVHWNLGLPKGPRVAKLKDMSVTTDALGRYSVVVVPGYYDICVHATAFSPTCTTVKAEQGASVTYDPKLKMSPLISSEIGDVIPTGGPTTH